MQNWFLGLEIPFITYKYGVLRFCSISVVTCPSVCNGFGKKRYCHRTINVFLILFYFCGYSLGLCFWLSAFAARRLAGIYTLRAPGPNVTIFAREDNGRATPTRKNLAPGRT
jgi:hypothetical protein